MMDIEDKKFLVLWMGWIYYKLTNEEGFVKQAPRTIKKDIGVFHLLKDWNPGTDHKQFKEVWKKLSDVQLARVAMKRAWGAFYSYAVANDILCNLPDVMEKVLEVLREK